MQMNEEPILYNASNQITRHAAILALEEFTPKLTWNKGKLKVVDIGCGDGSVTEILKRYIPENDKILIGYDISNAMVEFANANYGNDKTKFMQLDITADLPAQLKEMFSHVFSFYAFHWIKDQQSGINNIYNLLVKGGECLVTQYGYTPFYKIYLALSKTKRWGPYMNNVNDLISPFHDHQSPDITLTELLKKAGFSNINVQCKQMVHIFKDEEYRNIVRAINPYKMPTLDMQEDFLNAYVEKSRALHFVDEDTQLIKHNYNMLVFHCVK